MENKSNLAVNCSVATFIHVEESIAKEIKPNNVIKHAVEEKTETTLAIDLIERELTEAETTLAPFQIPLRRDDSRKPNNPYLATTYNADDLECIGVTAYEKELLKDKDHLNPQEFKQRVRSGLKEEVIHALQILSTKERFKKLPQSTQEKEKTPGDFYRKVQKELFEELSSTKEGRNLLIASGKLYYANPKISSIEDLKNADITHHKREGYITVELTRQIIQIRLGEVTSEESLKKAWDKAKSFGYGAHKKQLEALAQTIRKHASEPSKISPLMGEIVKDIENLTKIINEKKEKSDLRSQENGITI
jgi:hypothetical protein